MLNTIYLLLGTNLGDKLQNLETACTAIAEQVGSIHRRSSVYETAAWGKEDQPSFLNQVVHVETVFPPEELLQTINKIEKALGRIREEKWGARLIDIDLLYYDSIIIESPDLTVPHPGIPDRRFTLIPLAELAPKFIHPLLDKTNQELLKACTDPLEARVYFTPSGSPAKNAEGK